MINKSFAKGIRKFASFPKEIQFPYIFGNKKFTEYPFRIAISDTPSTILGIKYAYRALLSAIVEGDMEGLKKMTENRLFTKLETQYRDLIDQNYSFLLENTNDDIGVQVKKECKIYGGYIDRRKEKGFVPIQISKRVPKYAIVYIIMDEIRRGAELNLITKLIVHIKTSFKMNLRNKEGKLLLQQSKDKENHEIIVEGISQSYSVQDRQSIISLMKKSMRMQLTDVTIVDFDNCLKGNPHEGSSYI